MQAGVELTCLVPSRVQLMKGSQGRTCLGYPALKSGRQCNHMVQASCSISSVGGESRAAHGPAPISSIITNERATCWPSCALPSWQRPGLLSLSRLSQPVSPSAGGRCPPAALDHHRLNSTAPILPTSPSQAAMSPELLHLGHWQGRLHMELHGSFRRCSSSI